MDAARWTPRKKDSLWWGFTITWEDEIKAELIETLNAGDPGINAINSASVLIVSLRQLKKSDCDEVAGDLRENRVISDLASATENMAITARGLGIDIARIALFNQNKVGTILAVPNGYCAVEMLALGYPDGEVKAPLRK